MTQSPRPQWQPCVKWHLKALAAAAVCVVLLFAAFYTAFHLLPDTFAPKRPAPQTTPWLTE